MLQEERFARIRSLVDTFSRVSTERVASDLNISRETARRDLVDLEAAGSLRRVHGGAVAVGPQPEAALSVRQRSNPAQKRRIAKAAVKLIGPGQTVFLDAGTTTSALAEELATLSGLTIVTNSLAIALKLSAAHRQGQGHRTVLLGGLVHADTQATYGDLTIGEIHRYNADIALLSPVGIDAHNGATSFEHHECEVARAMALRSQRVILLADHSKIGQVSRVSYVTTSRVGTLVTDSGAGKLPGLIALRKAGCPVVLA